MAVDDSSRILALNAAAEALFGLPGLELVGAAAGRLFPAWDPLAATPGTSPRLEACHADGTTFPVRLAIARLERGPWFLLRVEPEAAAPAADATLAPEPLGEQFLLTLSHELRTPLQAMLSWTQLLRSSPFHESLSLRGLEAIERNIRWQVEVIDDVLELSQLASGALPLERRPMRWSEVVEEAVADASEQARDRHIRLARTIDPEERPVLADRQWVLRVLRTLLSSSLKFTGESGTIDLDLRRMGSFMQLTIADSNPEGAEDSRRAHDAFRQGNPSATLRFEGLGVALVKVQSMVRKMGGDVAAESAGFGNGARLVVSLPIASAE